MHLDFFEKEIKIGDVAAFLEPYYGIIVSGTIIELKSDKALISYLDFNRHQDKLTITIPCNKLIIKT